MTTTWNWSSKSHSCCDFTKFVESRILKNYSWNYKYFSYLVFWFPMPHDSPAKACVPRRKLPPRNRRQLRNPLARRNPKLPSHRLKKAKPAVAKKSTAAAKNLSSMSSPTTSIVEVLLLKGLKSLFTDHLQSLFAALPLITLLWEKRGYRDPCLPAVFKAPIRPDIVSLIHHEVAKKKLKIYGNLPFLSI